VLGLGVNAAQHLGVEVIGVDRQRQLFDQHARIALAGGAPAVGARHIAQRLDGGRNSIARGLADARAFVQVERHRRSRDTSDGGDVLDTGNTHETSYFSF
jgi:hypothetical protein